MGIGIVSEEERKETHHRWQNGQELGIKREPSDTKGKVLLWLMALALLLWGLWQWRPSASEQEEEAEKSTDFIIREQKAREEKAEPQTLLQRPRDARPPHRLLSLEGSCTSQ